MPLSLLFFVFFLKHLTLGRKPPAAFQFHPGNRYPSALRQSPISNYIPCCSCTASVLAVFWCASFFSLRPFFNALWPFEGAKWSGSIRSLCLQDNLDEPSQTFFFLFGLLKLGVIKLQTHNSVTSYHATIRLLA